MAASQLPLVVVPEWPADKPRPDNILLRTTAEIEDSLEADLRTAKIAREADLRMVRESPASEADLAPYRAQLVMAEKKWKAFNDVDPAAVSAARGAHADRTNLLIQAKTDFPTPEADLRKFERDAADAKRRLDEAENPRAGAVANYMRQSGAIAVASSDAASTVPFAGQPKSVSVASKDPEAIAAVVTSMASRNLFADMAEGAGERSVTATPEGKRITFTDANGAQAYPPTTGSAAKAGAQLIDRAAARA